jgi:hypothetical protein
MTITRSIVSNALLECLTITLSNESGTLDLKNPTDSRQAMSSKGAIVRVFTKFSTTSAGQGLDLQQDDSVVLALDDADSVFTTKNDLFNRPGFVFSTDDSLKLVYAVTNAVTVKIYYALNPQM